MTSFAEVAPLALMSGSIELLRAWVIETLGTLADDDEQGARLRDTLRVFLQENGSYKTTAERLVLHKNTVQYRVRKAGVMPLPAISPVGPDIQLSWMLRRATRHPQPGCCLAAGRGTRARPLRAGIFRRAGG